MEEEDNIKAFALAVAVYAIILMTLMIIVALIVGLNSQDKKEVNIVNVEEVNIEEQEEPLWEYLIQALIVVESEGNQLAVGKTNDVGVLQITPIYVEEVNRILDTPKYTLDMRTSIDYSLEMFEVYQSHHNPDKDIARAIKLHNPRAGQWYTEKVMNQLNKLIEF